MNNYDVAIIGGGAAGSYLAALLASRGRGHIALIEAGERLGRKLAATGNGQGNLTNVHMSADKYFSAGGDGHELIASVVGDDYRAVLSPFCGIFTADSLGRVYPAGRQASALTDALRRTIGAAANVDVLSGAKVAKLDQGYKLTLAGGRSLGARFVALCAGGKAQKQFGTDGSAYALAARFGHRVTPLCPALVQLKTDTTHIKALRGLRADCLVTAKADGKAVGTARGDVIFADYGVTGNAIFTVSSYVTGRDRASLSLAFLPDVGEDEIARDVDNKRRAGYAREELLACTLNNQLGRAIVRRCASDDPRVIAHAVKNFELTVNGTLGFDNAQVTRGGIALNGVTDELESKLTPGLYFAGEILDVDGECGGYNLHWAFASARRVFEALTKKL